MIHEASVEALLIEIAYLLRQERAERHQLGVSIVQVEMLKGRIDAVFERAKARWSGWLPFRGRYVDALRDFLKANVDRIGEQLQAFLTQGDYHAAVSFLLDYARGNLSLPWYVAPFTGMLFESLRGWLLANPEKWASSIGQAPPIQGA